MIISFEGQRLTFPLQALKHDAHLMFRSDDSHPAHHLSALPVKIHTLNHICPLTSLHLPSPVASPFTCPHLPPHHPSPALTSRLTFHLLSPVAPPNFPCPHPSPHLPSPALTRRPTSLPLPSPAATGSSGCPRPTRCPSGASRRCVGPSEPDCHCHCHCCCYCYCYCQCCPLPPASPQWQTDCHRPAGRP